MACLQQVECTEVLLDGCVKQNLIVRVGKRERGGCGSGSVKGCLLDSNSGECECE